jgi:DNA-binding transcriptional LysR family regulator
MPRHIHADLLAFLAVAQDKSFTRAAGRLGLSQSALSHAIRGLEEHLGTRLLARTTRSVAVTEAGERLMTGISPHFAEIEGELAALGELRGKLAGTIRITAADHAAKTILWPKLKSFLPHHPAIRIEIVADYGLTDIVAERFDAGVRLGEQVAKDMIAVPLGPPLRSVVVGASSYFSTRKKPKVPGDLVQHNCINLRLPTHGGLYAWEFEKQGREVKVRVDGQWVFNNLPLRLEAALAGVGLGYFPEDQVRPWIAKGKLVQVLADWCQPYVGYHLYYPNRRQHTPAFAAMVEHLRYHRKT